MPYHFERDADVNARALRYFFLLAIERRNCYIVTRQQLRHVQNRGCLDKIRAKQKTSTRFQVLGKAETLMIVPQEKLKSQALAKPVYSIVAPVFNEEETIQHFYERILTVMENVGEPFELVLVNDGSRDKSFNIMRVCM